MNIFEVIVRKRSLDPEITREDALEYLRWADKNDKNFYKNMRTIYAKFGNDPEVRKELLRHGFYDPEFLWSITEEDLKDAALNPLVCEEIVIHMSFSEIVNVLQRWKAQVEESKRRAEEAKKRELENLMRELGLSADDVRTMELIDLVLKIRAAKDCSLYDAKELAEQLKELVTESQQQTK
jgi:hypothetical protein